MTFYSILGIKPTMEHISPRHSWKKSPYFYFSNGYKENIFFQDSWQGGPKFCRGPYFFFSSGSPGWGGGQIDPDPISPSGSAHGLYICVPV